ncbi:Ribosomal protein L7/L12 C-terminal domain-containing protein [Actinomadura meyerae]|uniref:Ribosomal protein L7/L12 C-terminal domain-containing protein n=1 Tax=Actinomadura meyerae TaxID=240840 RepID=A0A239J5D2_9ACTN|nr:ribosomal protein L7/L12 [Actinomadura meyerae]SNT01057.1 Ribosomal protein L7/L12 C-terminal domain-containing protein [Actinomadura meyerae]
MKYPVSAQYLLPEAYERVVRLVAEEKYIPAIKLVREATGLGLKEAKEYVDGLKGQVFAQQVPPEVQAKARAMIGEGRTKPAVKMVRAETGLGLRAAKDFIDALREGRVHAPADTGPGGLLSDRVRAFLAAGDHASAVALVCAETGMRPDEAERFVAALG